MVSAEDVIKIYKRLSTNGIQIWLTGGWGIDALLGEQTRPHKDLDVFMLLDDVVRMRNILSKDGFELKELWSENRTAQDINGNETATAFVLHDSDGREFDVHAMNLDEQGHGIPTWDEAEGFFFTKQDLSGDGRIVDVEVKCITPESQMTCHSGYELPEKQLTDLKLLHDAFDVNFPKGHT